MKGRNGYVSNSSSSSFYIYGVELSNVGFCFEDMCQKLGLEGYDPSDPDEFYRVFELLGITALDYISNGEHGLAYVGRMFGSIKDDETGAQFRKSTADMLEKLCGKPVKCAIQEGVIYN